MIGIFSKCIIITWTEKKKGRKCVGMPEVTDLMKSLQNTSSKSDYFTFEEKYCVSCWQWTLKTSQKTQFISPHEMD